MPNYLVTITAYKKVYVKNAPDQDEAYQVAEDAMPMGVEIDDVVVREHTGSPPAGADVEEYND